MSLLGIIETLRRNLKALITGCWIVLALVVIADVARVMTAGEHHAPTSEHAAAPVGEHAVAPATEHSAHAAVASEHSAPLKSEISDLKSAPHGDAHSVGSAEEGGFWASAYHIAENVPVFWTLFGFLGCVLIVVVSKTYGHLGVSEREDYYSE